MDRYKKVSKTVKPSFFKFWTSMEMECGETAATASTRYAETAATASACYAESDSDIDSEIADGIPASVQLVCS